MYPPPQPNYGLLAMLACIMIIAIGVCTGCNVIKGKRSVRSNTDSVSRKVTQVIDTGSGGSTHKEVSDTHEAFDWSRLTLQYPRDTNVTNIYNYPQRPGTVIYETGSSTKDSQTQTFDSSWFKNAFTAMQATIDSLSRQVAISSKDKETRPSIWLFVGIVAVIVIICLVAYNYIGKFKIVKKLA